MVHISYRIPSGRGFPLDHQGEDAGEDQKDSQEFCEMKLAIEEKHRKNGHREDAGIPYGSGEAWIRRPFDCFKVGPVADGRENARERSDGQETEEFFRAQDLAEAWSRYPEKPQQGEPDHEQEYLPGSESLIGEPSNTEI